MTNYGSSHQAKLANHGTWGMWEGFVNGYSVSTYHPNGIDSVHWPLNRCNLRLWNPEMINNGIWEVWEQRLMLNIIDGLQDYLFCNMKLLMDNKRAWLREAHLIDILEKKLSNKGNMVWHDVIIGKKSVRDQIFFQSGEKIQFIKSCIQDLTFSWLKSCESWMVVQTCPCYGHCKWSNMCLMQKKLGWNWSHWPCKEFVLATLIMPEILSTGCT